MSITLYEKPNYEGESFTFDPTKTKNVIFYKKGFKASEKDVIFFRHYTKEEFFIGSIKNTSNDYDLFLINVEQNDMHTLSGSIKKTTFFDTPIHGFIKIEKNKTYKTEMIVFICLCCALVVLLTVLFFTGHVKFHKNIEYF